MRISKMACATRSIKVWGFYGQNQFFFRKISPKMTNFAAANSESCSLWGLYHQAIYKPTSLKKIGSLSPKLRTSQPLFDFFLNFGKISPKMMNFAAAKFENSSLWGLYHQTIYKPTSLKKNWVLRQKLRTSQQLFKFG